MQVVVGFRSPYRVLHNGGVEGVAHVIDGKGGELHYLGRGSRREERHKSDRGEWKS